MEIENHAIHTGEIKVSYTELKKLLQIVQEKEISGDNLEYLNYFSRKYIILPDIRSKEHDAYQYLKQAEKLDKKSELYQQQLQEYNQFRSKRKQLQEELRKEKERKYNYLL